MNRSPNLLLVEGTDDLHLLLHLLYAHWFQRADLFPPERYAIERPGTDDRIELKDKGGFENLSRTLRLELTPTHLQRLAVIVDSDEAPDGRACERRFGSRGMPTYRICLGPKVSSPESRTVPWLVFGSCPTINARVTSNISSLT